MRKNYAAYMITAAVVLCSLSFRYTTHWLELKKKNYIVYYQTSDQQELTEYLKLTEKGIETTELFFGDVFKKEFKVFIHPDRNSLDSTWQHDWQAPDFKSECWMVASGTATQLDMLSPMRWGTDACEHQYSDKEETQKLITHEFVHVYHGQYNKSPDFSDVANIDWFVEGLAVYASGQYDSVRIQQVQNAIKEDKIPASLDNFWTGKIKYALSGSVVMYIDKTFGRDELNELLVFNRKDEILNALNISEAELIANWKAYISKE